MAAAHRKENANILVCQSLNWLLGEDRVTSEEKGRADGKFIDLNFTGKTRIRVFIEAKYAGRDVAAARRAADAAAEGPARFTRTARYCGRVGIFAAI